jgi:hypothetical protein
MLHIVASISCVFLFFSSNIIRMEQWHVLVMVLSLVLS